MTETETVTAADARLLRDTAAMSDKLKVLLVPHGATADGWDDWAARLRALADVLEKVTSRHLDVASWAALEAISARQKYPQVAQHFQNIQDDAVSLQVILAQLTPDTDAPAP